MEEDVTGGDARVSSATKVVTGIFGNSEHHLDMMGHSISIISILWCQSSLSGKSAPSFRETDQ